MPMSLQIQDLDQPYSWEHRQEKIEPSFMKIIEINIPEGTIPYFKVWENNTAFLSYINPETFRL